MAVQRKSRAVERYGCLWPFTDPIEIELDCIRRGGTWTTPQGATHGHGLAFHVMAFAKLVWPWVHWHRWNTDLIVPELCRQRARVAVWGPSSSGKSCITGVTALTLYFAHPDDTTVLVSSTTREELELRIWGEIKMLWKEAREVAPWLPGHLTDSKQMITTDGKDVEGRDFRNGVIGRPCRRGSQWVGLGPMVGIKNTNMIVVADELHLMENGFLDSLANLTSNPACRSYGLGNLNELDSQLGQMAEPDNGWDSLHDSEVSRVYNTRWNNGRSVQLIGKDSPQLDFPEGHEPFGPLIGRRYLQQCAEDYGIDTPLYNMFAAGKIPRGTMENRVITKAVCQKFNAYEEVTWGHEATTRLYCADISYTGEHGDRTVGRPLAFGRDVDGRLRLAPLDRPLIYTPNDRSSGSIEEQLASQMMAECKKWEIPPERVFFDGTGRSSFTAAVMRLWSTSVNPIEFGGSATIRANFIGRRYHEDLDSRRRKGDSLPCNEVFGKMVTELWFAFRYLVEADQCRGIDEETVKEASLRLWKLTMGNKMDVEPKKEMKLRLGRSPDLADCFVGHTMVRLDSGWCPISLVKVGDMVVTPFGLSPVIIIHEQQVEETIKVFFSSGLSLEGKGNHKVFTWDSGWVPLDSLSIGNEYESIDDLPEWESLNLLFTQDTRTSFKALVDIFKTGERMCRSDFYTELSGSTTLARFLRVSMSTIKTMTGAILFHTISNCAKKWSTAATMLSNAIQIIQNGLSSGGLLESRPQLLGIPLTQGSSGTQTIPSVNGPKRKQRVSSVTCANENSTLTFQIKPSTAPVRAKVKRPGLGTELRKIAKSAAILLKAYWLTKSNIAPVAVERLRQPARKKVYCITLEEHNIFYANGILVENCFVVGLEGARRLGFPLGQLVAPQKRRSQWLSKLNRDYLDAREALQLTDAA